MRCITPLGLTKEEIKHLELIDDKLRHLNMDTGLEMIYKHMNDAVSKKLFINVVVSAGGNTALVQRVKG